MKPTVKVSIGGYAFNLEEDAYKLTEDYLRRLKTHFSGKAEGEEIIADVEARMAELLQMKMQANSEIVTVENASDVIQIMGNPKDFDDNPADESSASAEPSEKPRQENSGFSLRKKLYRDTENSVLGGVCSGLGYYFKIDPVIIRLIFVGLLIIPNIFSWTWLVTDRHFHSSPSIGFLTVLFYMILWIVVPKAQTLKEKIVMTGKDPSISNIEESGNVQLRRSQPSTLLKVIKVFFGILLGLISISLIISLVAVLGAFFGFYSVEYGNVNDFLDILGINSLDLKIALLITLLLPLIALLDLSIKLLFQLRFKKTDLVLMIFAFVIWIGAAFYFGGTAIKMVSQYERKAGGTETFLIDTASDTLYITMPKEYLKAESISNEDLSIYKLRKKKGETSVFLPPSIRIKKDSALTAFRVEVEKKAYDSSRRNAQNKVRAYKPKYEVKDSLLLLSPKLYSKKHPWDREHYDIVITAPVNKTVYVEDPLIRN